MSFLNEERRILKNNFCAIQSRHNIMQTREKIKQNFLHKVSGT
jgi:hypothetical protein